MDSRDLVCLRLNAEMSQYATKISQRTLIAMEGLKKWRASI